jgi:hypothetical protein
MIVYSDRRGLYFRAVLAAVGSVTASWKEIARSRTAIGPEIGESKG